VSFLDAVVGGGKTAAFCVTCSESRFCKDAGCAAVEGVGAGAIPPFGAGDTFNVRIFA
jgi:hypothetical protein